jgi:hypothetical protein
MEREWTGPSKHFRDLHELVCLFRAPYSKTSFESRAQLKLAPLPPIYSSGPPYFDLPKYIVLDERQRCRLAIAALNLRILKKYYLNFLLKKTSRKPLQICSIFFWNMLYVYFIFLIFFFFFYIRYFLLKIIFLANSELSKDTYSVTQKSTHLSSIRIILTVSKIWILLSEN